MHTCISTMAHSVLPFTIYRWGVFIERHARANKFLIVIVATRCNIVSFFVATLFQYSDPIKHEHRTYTQSDTNTINTDISIEYQHQTKPSI